ncbi:hypothetical protein CEXT_367321 [Caerostris extrusa]|uniref:Uncharacterized protein n=1 Tax=Caerostris extrusa TaxID=172846 RepID=A0AAV4UDZ4_CAEEX|nr:hypothetical protein CEXT_367321 [Caerostris extrusa]
MAIIISNLSFETEEFFKRKRQLYFVPHKADLSTFGRRYLVAQCLGNGMTNEEHFLNKEKDKATAGVEVGKPVFKTLVS